MLSPEARQRFASFVGTPVEAVPPESVHPQVYHFQIPTNQPVPDVDKFINGLVEAIIFRDRDNACLEADKTSLQHDYDVLARLKTNLQETVENGRERLSQLHDDIEDLTHQRDSNARLAQVRLEIVQEHARKITQLDRRNAELAHNLREADQRIVAQTATIRAQHQQADKQSAHIAELVAQVHDKNTQLNNLTDERNNFRELAEARPLVIRGLEQKCVDLDRLRKDARKVYEQWKALRTKPVLLTANMLKLRDLLDEMDSSIPDVGFVQTGTSSSQPAKDSPTPSETDYAVHVPPLEHVDEPENFQCGPLHADVIPRAGVVSLRAGDTMDIVISPSGEVVKIDIRSTQ